jgi:alginate O-acetyltransferase complex protein AlgI
LRRAIWFFHVTCFGWLLFGVHQLADVPLLVGNAFRPFELNGLLGLTTLVVFAAPLVWLDWLQFQSSDLLVVQRSSRPLRAAIYLATFAAVLLCGAAETRQFIYFQF